MARCIDCVTFPWKPETSLFQLPAAKCDPSIPMRRWTDDQARAEHDCSAFVARDGAEAAPAAQEAARDGTGEGSAHTEGDGATSDDTAGDGAGEDELDARNVEELKAMAQGMGVSGVSRMNKRDLITTIREARGGGNG